MWSSLHPCGINNLAAVPTTLRVDLDYKLPTTLNIRTRNRIYIKRDNIIIKRIISDLRDVIADSKKVVLF